MQLPRWATTRNHTFWRRHYELATLTEQACEQVIEQQLQKCSRKLSSRTDVQKRRRMISFEEQPGESQNVLNALHELPNALHRLP
jgi:hypothetical protein